MMQRQRQREFRLTVYIGMGVSSVSELHRNGSGNVLGLVMTKPNDMREVYFARTDIRSSEECWPWLGGVNAAGYGVICHKGKKIKATHVALILDGKPRPDSLHALHSCDNPPCVNPAHLRWGTTKDNMQDKAARGRSNNGIHSNFKRTDELKEKILASDINSSALAKTLGVSKSTVSRVRKEAGFVASKYQPMRDKVTQVLLAVAGADGVVRASQMEIAKITGLASSNVNLVIKHLVAKGEAKRLPKVGRLCPIRLMS